MKAVVITEFGSPEVLKLAEKPIPEIAEHEVLIHVKAAGVNRPDVIQRQGFYPAPADAPQDIAGLEVAGEIVAYGKKVKKWKNGDKVCALIAGGGYAEYAKAHEGVCLPIPRGFTYVEAAALPETIFTVWSNVFQRGGLKADETFLVHGGSSGIGITAIQLAKAFEARVLTTVGSEEKGLACMQLGADRFINYKRIDFLEAFADEKINVILDMVGGDYFEKNMKLLSPDGRLVYINAMKENKVSLNIMQMMLKRITITGSTLRSREIDFKTALAEDVYKNVWAILDAGRYNPMIYATFSFEEAAQAHALMESSQHIGKIVLVNE